MNWYVPHAIADENDWIATLILTPEKNPAIPSYLKIAAVVSIMLWYLIYEFAVTNNIWAGWPIKLGFLRLLLNFWVFFAIFSQTDRLPQGPLRQVWVFNLVLMTSKGVVGIEARPPAIPPHK